MGKAHRHLRRLAVFGLQLFNNLHHARNVIDKTFLPLRRWFFTKAAMGTLSGTVTLMPEQLEALKQGRLYVQVHSEKGINPEQGKTQPDVDHSNLWGWLLR